MISVWQNARWRPVGLDGSAQGTRLPIPPVPGRPPQDRILAWIGPVGLLSCGRDYTGTNFHPRWTHWRLDYSPKRGTLGEESTDAVDLCETAGKTSDFPDVEDLTRIEKYRDLFLKTGRLRRFVRSHCERSGLESGDCLAVCLGRIHGNDCITVFSTRL